MRGRPSSSTSVSSDLKALYKAVIIIIIISCLLQSDRGEANKIFLASALSSMHIICPNKVSWRDWIIAVSLGCSVHHHSVQIGTT